MDISVFASSKSTNISQFSEGAIFNSIRTYIKDTNFPKKLLLKKLDLIVDTKKASVTKYAKMLALARQACQEHAKQIEVLRSRNARDLQDLIDFLS